MLLTVFSSPLQSELVGLHGIRIYGDVSEQCESVVIYV